MLINHGDITKIDGTEVESVDCIIGGSPCQNLSISGNKQGLDGNESRLFLEQMRVVEEMRVSSNGTKPRYMVWENVPFALSCNKGKDFQRVLMECVNVAVRTSVCLEKREREYTKNSQTETKERMQSIPDVPMPKDGKWSKSGILYDDMGRWSIAWRIHDAQYWGVAQRRRRIALVVDFGGMSAPEVLFEQQSVSGNFDQIHTQGEGIAETSTGSIEESDQVWDARGNGSGQICATLTGDHDNRITDYTNVVVQKDLTYSINGDANESGICVIEECYHTLKTTTKESVFVNNKTKEQNNPCICIGNGQSHVTNHYTVDLCQTLNCMHDPMTILEPVQSHYCVRRLTPLECTRLQGFPDGWVDIGDWIDSKCKKHKQADAPKYKAIGNSIALPFWKWLCKNIVTELCKNGNTTTMASLFDGIGGFPLCWTEVTGKVDNVKWISEIEEFPIAVTRCHFG